MISSFVNDGDKEVGGGFQLFKLTRIDCISL